jgi:hypothetical protein
MNPKATKSDRSQLSRDPRKGRNMNTQKGILVFALTLALSALQVNPAVLAKPAPPVTPVTFSYQRLNVLDPGKVWVDAQGLHIRDRVETGTLSGSINGFARFVYNADLKFASPTVEDPTAIPASANGTAYGTVEIYGIDPGLINPEGTWNGKWTFTISKGKVVGGSLDAINLSQTKVMTITVVKENATSGALTFQGAIKPNICGAVCGE